MEGFVALGHSTVLNIGCAEGYYAVGLARRMPQARVLAFDINRTAQDTCRALAAKNGVADRVQVSGLFKPADFAAYGTTATLPSTRSTPSTWSA